MSKAQAYYNEIDPYAAQWLRNLISAGLIAPGVVDQRSIEDVRPADLREFTQCHFFAGIGVWSYALRQAGWRDDQQVWTGSCPCQPFSQAGKGDGFTDERHLWPAFYHLIQECGPERVFGEQVASKDGLAWVDLVQADMEASNYAFGAFDLCSAGFGSPNIRQRLYWVADSNGERFHPLPQPGSPSAEPDAESCSGMDNTLGDGRGTGRDDHTEHDRIILDTAVHAGLVADSGNAGRQGRVSGLTDSERQAESGHLGRGGATGNAGPTNGFWRAADWLLCRDGNWRPVESGTFPLASGATARVGRLRAYGNAINAEVATEFVRAYTECRP